MKKTFFGVLVASITLSLVITMTFAAGTGYGHNFTDKNEDGVCDYAGSVCVYVDTDGDELCDVCGKGHSDCPAEADTSFVDADGDGICDHYGTSETGCGWNDADTNEDGGCDYSVSCPSRGYGRSRGSRNFSDAGGDGVCDNGVYNQDRGCRGGRGYRGGRG